MGRSGTSRGAHVFTTRGGAALPRGACREGHRRRSVHRDGAFMDVWSSNSFAGAVETASSRWST
eukprot:6093917-Prymnesium_polylepis.1